ncbi:MAG: hypothetical protein ABIZ49_04700 [Opitutaceae bacterium]
MKFPFALLALLVGSGLAFAAEPKVSPAAPKPESPRPPSAAGRASTATAPAVGFDAFRTIIDRNVFNPNRTGRRERVVEERPQRVDKITLVGTMNSDGSLRSFFDGSEPAYRKALRVGEAIAEFKVTRIGAEGIDLERDGKTISVRVGQQFRRPEGGDWTLIGAEVVRQEAQARSSTPAQIDLSAPVAIPADADELTKRLIEKRNRSLKQ